MIFRDDADRADFVARVAALAEQGAWTIYAWALLPNHAHLVVRTGTRPLPRSMRSLLTGYAGAFNRRHHRVGRPFQNRYKSIVVEEVGGPRPPGAPPRTGPRRSPRRRLPGGSAGGDGPSHLAGHPWGGPMHDVDWNVPYYSPRGLSRSGSLQVRSFPS
jgi:hypothetical protein